MRKRKICCLLGTVLTFPAFCGTVLSETDFTANGKAVNIDCRANGFGTFRGVLPETWRENGSSWKKTEGKSEIVRDPSGDYLKFTVSNGTQFFTHIPVLKKGQLYRVTAVLRNRTDAVVNVVFRGEKYKVYERLAIPYSKEWKSWTKTFRFDADRQTDLFLQIQGSGEVDLRSIRLEEAGEERPVLLNVDFSAASKRSSVSRTGRFSGILPDGWNEDYTHFADAAARSDIFAREGRSVLRFRVEKGMPQFMVPVSGLKPETSYVLTVTGENRTGEPVAFALRQISTPYRRLAAAALDTKDGWRTQKLILRTGEKLFEPAGLFMTLRGTGETDFASLRLEALPEGETVTKRPDAALKNFFCNSCFPLGLQSGWTQETMTFWFNIGMRGRISADPAVPGPSGEAALKLEPEPGKNIGLYSEPFNVAEPDKMHTVSFAVRGSGSYLAEVITEDKTLKRITFTPGTDWKRIEVPFQPLPDAPAFGLHLRGNGTVWLDSFRAAPSSERGYQPMAANGVALAFPESSASDARIHFPDERPELRWQVTGDILPGTELRSSVTNLYNETVRLAPVSVSGKNRSGVINYALFPKRPYGQFRVEVQLFRNGSPVSPVHEMVATRIIRPRYWGKDAPDSPFGIHVLPQPESLLAAKASGANWARLHDAGTNFIGWGYLEPEKGVWKFRDAELNAYRSAGLRLFGQLGTAPHWASRYSKSGRTAKGYFDYYFAPLRKEEFANYAAVVAGRYRGIIDEWFIWNEPWHDPFFAFGYDETGKKNHYRYWSAPDAPEKFAELSAAAYAAVKKANPDAVVCGFNTRAGSKQNWSKRVYDAGAMANCDALDYHFYAGRLLGYPDDDYAREAWKSAFGYIERKEGGKIRKPIYMSEGQGSPESAGSGECRYTGLLKHTILWDAGEDYHWLTDRNVRVHLSLLAIGVKRIFLYSMHGNRNFVQRARLRVMVNADGYPGPMLVGHSALTSRLEDKKYVGTRVLEPGFGAYVFSDGKSSVAVLSGKNGISGRRITSSLPGAAAADLYGNPLSFPVGYDGLAIYVEAPVPANVLKNSLQLNP